MATLKIKLYLQTRAAAVWALRLKLATIHLHYYLEIINRAGWPWALNTCRYGTTEEDRRGEKTKSTKDKLPSPIIC